VSITEVQIPSPDRIVYPVTDAAVYLGISRTKLFALIASGELETITIGRRRLVPHESMVTFVERLRQEQAG